MSTSNSFAPFAFPELATPVAGEIAERARVQGHAAGYAAGRREAAALLEQERAAQRSQADHLLATEIVRLRSAAAALEAAAAVLAARSAAVHESTDEAVLAAAVDIAELVIGRELLDGPASAIAAVRRALAVAGEVPVLAVRLHPEDLAAVDAIAADHPTLRFVADPALDRGDAVAELPDGRVDGRIAGSLERVRATIAGEDG